MTERDTDIEFDFFDEPETQETTQRRRLPRPPRGPQPPRRGPTGPPPGLTPLLRLVGLIALAIFVVVVLTVVVQSCRSDSKQAEYRDYVSAVKTIADGSAQVGRDLNDQLTTPGIKQSELVQNLDGLAQQQSQYSARAQEIDPPGPLRVQHQHLVEVLQLRASGLSRLADAFRQTAASKDATAAGALLAEQARLLTASDVNWDFYFKEPATRELKRQGITGVVVPDSNFVVNPDLASAGAMEPVFRRIHGASTGGKPTGVHGSSLESVKVLPGGQILSTSTETTVTATAELAFEVTVKNSGENQEVRIPVTLTIQKSPQPIIKKAVIDVIDPGETKVLVFRITEQPPFGSPTRVRVDVQPVPGEQRTSNNSAEYPVIFSL